jgi:hypothetical protein
VVGENIILGFQSCSYGVFACISGSAEDDIYTFYAAAIGVFVMWDQGWHQFFLHWGAGV